MVAKPCLFFLGFQVCLKKRGGLSRIMKETGKQGIFNIAETGVTAILDQPRGFCQMQGEGFLWMGLSLFKRDHVFALKKDDRFVADRNAMIGFHIQRIQKIIVYY